MFIIGITNSSIKQEDTIINITGIGVSSIPAITSAYVMYVLLRFEDQHMPHTVSY